MKDMTMNMWYVSRTLFNKTSATILLRSSWAWPCVSRKKKRNNGQPGKFKPGMYEQVEELKMILFTRSNRRDRAE